jgi:hypothetical protein
LGVRAIAKMNMVNKVNFIELVAIATILERTIEKCLFDSFLLLDE